MSRCRNSERDERVTCLSVSRGTRGGIERGTEVVPLSPWGMEVGPARSRITPRETETAEEVWASRAEDSAAISGSSLSVPCAAAHEYSSVCSEHEPCNNMNWIQLSNLKSVFRDHQGEVGWTLVTIALAEFVGTALLIFFTCLSSLVGMSQDPPVPLQVALCSGLTVAIIIQIFGHISAAHLNPAVSIAAVVLEQINIPLAIVYIVSECSGAIVGFGLLKALLPGRIMNEASPNGTCCEMCVTKPHQDLTLLQAVVMEGIVTATLILTVCASWDARNENKQDSIPLKFGFLVTTVAAVEGPFTGASMNPARSLGPAVWTGVWTSHWIYWAGPIGAAIIVSFLYKNVFNNKFLIWRPEHSDLYKHNETTTKQSSTKLEHGHVRKEVAGI